MDPTSGTARTVGATGLWALGALVGAGPLADPVSRGGVALAVTSLAVGCLLVTIAALRRGPARPSSVVLALVAVVLVSAGSAALRAVTLDSGALADVARRGATAQVDVRVAGEPRLTERGWWAIVRVEQLDGAPIRERALVREVESEPPPLGTRWRGAVTARALDRDGFHGFVRRLHAGTQLHVIGTWEPAGDPGALASASERVRAGLRGAVRDLPDPQAGIAVGIVTGDRRLLPGETERAMRETGLTHLIVVSGAKVAILAAGIVLLLRTARVGASGRRVVLASAIAWYVFVSRWEPSVLRAAVMAGVVMLAGARGNLGDARHSLAVAVLLLVLVDPGLAGSPGLLLSAGATAGVLVAAPLIIERAGREGRLARLVAITVGAQIGVAAPLLALFGELPIASIPANVLAVPLTAVASVPVFAATAVAWLEPAAAAPLLHAASPLLGAVGWVAETFSGRGGHIELARPDTVLAATAASVALVAVRRSGTRRVAAAVAAAMVLAAAGPGLLGGRSPGELTLTAIDVGQGDAFLVESPGARILVDGGPDDSAARWLRRNGRRHLDLAVATHAHADHVHGLGDVLRRVDVGVLWAPETGIDRATMEPALEAAGDRGVPLHHPVAGEVAHLGDVVIEVLGPPEGDPFRWSETELNDSSIVLRVLWQDRAVLLTGDIEVAGQTPLLSDPRRRAGAYTVPHHGAGTSIPDFLDVPGATVAIISAGRDNPYGHPHPETLAVLASLGLEVRRTDLEGTVSVAVPPPSPPGRHEQPAPTASEGVSSERGPAPRRRSAPRRGGRAPPPARAARTNPPI